MCKAGRSVAVCAAVLALSGAQAAEPPMWLNVAPLLPGHEAELAADQRDLFATTPIDAAAFIMTFTPEGDPVFDKAAVYAPRFRKMKELLRGAKGQCGVLFQATMGHGWTPDTQTPWQKVVSPDGGESYIFCPLGKEFLAYLARQAAQIAAERPDFFMIDDDTRLITGRNGCFCPLHLAEMKRLTGRALTRESLQKAIAEEPEVLQAWDALLRDSIVGIVRTVREAFDAVDPSIPGEFCCCAADVRHASHLARLAAAKGQTPVVRLNNGRYCHEEVRDISHWLSGTGRQLAAVSREAAVLAEPDTCPQNRYSMSAKDFHLHLTLSILEGCRGGKIWITRTGSYEPASGVAYRRSLKRYNGFYREILRLSPVWSGVKMPIAAVLRPTPKAEYAPWNWGSAVLGRFGVPYATTSAPLPVAALKEGDAARLTDDEIRELLKHSLLLDGGAAVVLTRRGFADLIGARAKEWTGPVASFEQLGDGVRINAKIDAVRLEPTGAVQIRSELHHRSAALDESSVAVGIGSYVFVNREGGKVAVLADNVPCWVNLGAFHFYNETRKRQVMSLLTELGFREPYYPGDAEVLFRTGTAKDGARIFLATVTGHDDLSELPLVFPAGDAPKAVERLGEDGKWAFVEVARGVDGSAVLKTPLRFIEPAVFRCK